MGFFDDVANTVSDGGNFIDNLSLGLIGDAWNNFGPLKLFTDPSGWFTNLGNAFKDMISLPFTMLNSIMYFAYAVIAIITIYILYKLFKKIYYNR